MRNTLDIFNIFLTSLSVFSKKMLNGENSFLSLHSHVKKWTKLTIAEIKVFVFSIPGRRAKNQKFFRSVSPACLSSRKSLLSISFLYRSLWLHSKNKWMKVSDWIGNGSLLQTQRLHSDSIPGTNLQTLELRPKILFLNLNKNSLLLLLKK